MPDLSRLAHRADTALTAAGVLMACGGVPACWAYSGWRFATGHPRDGWVYLFLAPLVLAFCGYMLAILPWASGSTSDGDAGPASGEAIEEPTP